MGHHIDMLGRFKSDKYPELPPDRVRLNIERPENWPGLLAVCDAYQESDPEFADDLRERIHALAKERALNIAALGEPTASEAVYLFAGWLTSRDEVSGPFSARHDASDMAKLVADYCDQRGWSDPRPGWGKGHPRLRMFHCDELPECLTIATDYEHAIELIRERYDKPDSFKLTVTEMADSDKLVGWCSWDQERQAHVYVTPPPTVAEVLAKDDIRACVVGGDDADDAVFDTEDGDPPEGWDE